MRFENWLAVRAWHKRRKRVKTDWNAEIEKFRSYLNSSKIIMDYADRKEGYPWMPTAPVDNDKGRSLGAPYDASLIQFLMRQMGMSESAALEYPMALAQVHFITFLEREGSLKVLNAEEVEFKDAARANDEAAAKLAGFSSVEEHVAFVIAESNKAKEAKRNG